MTRQSRFTEEEIISILQEHGAGAEVAELLRRHSISRETFYRWKQILELVRAGRTPEELAEEYEPSAATIHNWIAQAERERFRSRAEAMMRVFDFIEGWYNPHRRHSALGHRSPVAYEREQKKVA